MPLVLGTRQLSARLRALHELAFVKSCVMGKFLEIFIVVVIVLAFIGWLALADWWDDRAKMFAHKLATKS